MAKQDGFYLQNNTPFVTTAVLGPDCRLILQAKGDDKGRDIGFVPGKYKDHMTVRRMLSTGNAVEVSEAKAVKAEKTKAQADADKRQARTDARLEKVDTAPGEDYVKMQCCAETANGERCKRNATVKVKDAKTADNLVFCKVHEGTDRDGFVKNEDGAWVKAQVEAEA